MRLHKKEKCFIYKRNRLREFEWDIDISKVLCKWNKFFIILACVFSNRMYCLDVWHCYLNNVFFIIAESFHLKCVDYLPTTAEFIGKTFAKD